jgi:DMSO/TMAO reductase YedYZ molybdopterin-dependent catalytic subunit
MCSMHKPTPPDTFILRGGNAEMRQERIARHDYLTPTSEFFVRSNNGTPLLDTATWRLRVRGDGASRPLELSYADLLAMPSRTVTRYLECTGNGRTRFAETFGKTATGTDWTMGAFGVAEWAGVPLSHILDLAGATSDALEVMPIGADRIERPLRMSKARETDTLLVHNMNGQPLPPDHGFPARVLAPGWGAIASIKWVTDLVISKQHIFTDKNTNLYIYEGDGFVPNPPAKGPETSDGVVKSIVALPWPATLTSGQHRIEGFAFSPFGKIARVEVSLDKGGTWRDATLFGPNIERAGTKWRFGLDAQPGLTAITTRATDEHGNTQWPPGQQKWNVHGYNYGAWVNDPLAVDAL